MTRITGALLAMLLMVSGCCAPQYTPRVNCNDTLFCDIQTLLAIDEFSISYMRNTATCLEQARNPGAPCTGNCGPGAAAASASGE